MKPLADRLTDRELIHRGDLTLAYRARDSVLDRPVFVKALNPALAADEEIRARFEREAKAVARLDHPNLVRIYEYGEDPHEGLYMLLEWLEGETLASRIASGERWTGDKWRELAVQLLRGLAALHGVGILHRDLKPDNILVRKDISDSSRRIGIYKITDFSLAALRDAPKLTHHEAIVGTPAYMSPEQAAGGLPEERSDLFALGIVLCEAAFGKNPFAGTTMLETLQNVREKAISCDEPTVPAIPESGRNLLKSLLEKNPAERPSSARAALVMLGEKVSDVRLPKAPRSRKRDLQHLGAAAIIILIWAILMFWWPWGDHKKTAAPPVISSDTTEWTSAAADSLTKKTSSDSLVQENIIESSPVLPKTTVERVTELQTPPESKLPDSVNLWLFTDPWAHVFFGGRQVGTTPLAVPLRIPSGEQEIVLRNPAFPPVQVGVYLTERQSHETIRFADHVALLRVLVAPWGDLYVDGEAAGTSPLERPLFISPGRHSLRISHPQLSALEREFQAAAGETLDVNVDLTKAEWIVKREGKSVP